MVLLHMFEQLGARNDRLTRIKDAYQARRAVQTPDVEVPLEVGTVVVVRVGIPLLRTADDVAGMRRPISHLVLVGYVAPSWARYGSSGMPLQGTPFSLNAPHLEMTLRALLLPGEMAPRLDPLAPWGTRPRDHPVAALWKP